MLYSVGNCEEVKENETAKGLQETVTIVCKGGKSATWPRRKLADISEYFMVLLYGCFRERELEKIEFHDVDGDLLKLLLDFYENYKSRIQNHDDPKFSRIFIRDFATAWNLIKVADMFDLEKASDECERYILQTLDTHDDTLSAWMYAGLFRRALIQQEIMRRWLLSGGRECASHQVLEDLCICHYMKNYREIYKFYVIGGYYFQLFRDCYQIDAAELARDQFAELSTSSKICHKNDEIRRVHSFENRQRYIGPHNEESRTAVLGTDIYVTGGFDHEARAVNQVWKYDSREDSWTRVSDLRRGRFYHCMVAIGLHIYVCGGFDDNFVVDSLERYHPHENEWVELAKMPTGVGNAACASDERGIYVTCGQYGYKHIHTTNLVQHYEVETDQWSILTSYKSPVFYPHSEYGLSSTVMNGKLIVLGGQTERCDAYGFREKQWKRIADMHCRRMETSVTSYGGRIYAAGGYDYRTGHFHDTIEEYDPDKDAWRILHQKLPRASRSVGFCCIFDVERKSC